MRTTLFVGVLMAFAFAMAPAHADGGRLCPSMSKALVSKVVAWIKGKGQSKAFCTGCGCKGGPGFRDSEGNCVRWAEVNAASYRIAVAVENAFRSSLPAPTMPSAPHG